MFKKLLARLPMPVQTLILFIRDAASEWKQDDASILAAALAYHTAFSLTPLLIIILAIAGTFWGTEAVHGYFIDECADSSVVPFTCRWRQVPTCPTAS